MVCVRYVIITASAAKVLAARLEDTRDLYTTAEEYLSGLARIAGPGRTELWEQQIALAERVRYDNPAAMDIMKTRPSEEFGTTKVTEEDQAATSGTIQSWISAALEFEEQQ